MADLAELEPPGVALTVPHEFQYSSMYHQAEASLCGMWLFLAQECLFFGALFLAWMFSRYWNIAGFDAGSAKTELWIGSLNTGILITSSFVYALALLFMRAGFDRAMSITLCFVAVLGTAFLCMKGYEWHLDFVAHPGILDPLFPVKGALEGGAKLFFTFYWLGTVLHAAHMTVAITLVLVTARRGFKREFSVSYHTPVEVVGIFWSFVDVVWMILWPMIYLIGRTT